MAKSVGLSVLISTPLSLLGLVGFAGPRPKVVWIVLTGERVLLVERPNKKSARDLL